MATSPQRTGVIVFLLVVIFMAGVGVYIMPYTDTSVVVETQYSKTLKSKTPVTSAEKKHLWTHDETKEDSSAFMSVQEQIQENRRSILKEGCRKYYTKPSRDILANGIDKNTLIVDDEYKLLYCFVPKVACTNWKRVFLVLSGIYKSTNDVSQYTANRSLRKLKTFRNLKKAERTRILQTYTKFIFVRHPFSRLLSAFKNKLSPESSFERAEYWRNTIGMQIMLKNRRLTPLNRTTWRNWSKTYDLRFEEFVRHVGNPNRPLPQNKHWKEIVERCYPCDIDYDVIGKFETLNDDAKYILKLAKVDHLVDFPKPDASSPTNSSNLTTLESYYEQVPKEDLQNLIRRYHLDFALFGYTPQTQDPDPLYHKNSTSDSEIMSWADDLRLFP